MKLFKLFTSLLLLSNSLFSFATDIPNMSTDKYTIDFNGASGGFKLMNNADNTFYNMRYGWLTETPSNKLNLDFNIFDYGSNENVTYLNTELIENNFSIQIKNELWKDNKEYINDKNQTVLVDKDVMKMTIMMSGWNFQNFDNDLTLDFTLSNNLGSSISNLYNSSIKLREFDFIFDKTVIVDNVVKNIIFYTQGNKYYLTFPSFQNDLYYDPTIMFIGNANKVYNIQPQIFIIFLSLLSLMCLGQIIN